MPMRTSALVPHNVASVLTTFKNPCITTYILG
jgi:hypothetical protein